MPSGVRGLRSMFHATAVEVLLYLTPVHCQDMLDSLTNSLNATFTAFMKRNPAFKVSHHAVIIKHHDVNFQADLSCEGFLKQLKV